MPSDGRINVDKDETVRILAIETSGRQGSIALALGPTLLEEFVLPVAAKHATGLLPAVDQLFRKYQWAPAQLDQVYVSTGPGSFTGLRIAIAVAKSLAMATGCRLVAVPTLDVVAQNAPAGTNELVVLLDAKRSQVFAARYRRTQDLAPRQFIRTAGPALADPASFVRAALEEATAGGDVPAKVVVLGEGVAYHRAALRSGVDADHELVECDPPVWPGRAAAVHALGWERAQAGAFTPAQELLPVYIRLAEAEELWNKRHGVGGGVNPLETPSKRGAKRPSGG